ncbi:MAG: hypothetical protein II755_10570 [Prevotella sp.]|nr:hypothetical protein [Prevotella sp.]
MKKKRLLQLTATLALLLLPLTGVMAQGSDAVKCMVLKQSDGTVSSFALREAPMVSYEDANIVVSCGEQTFSTPLAGIDTWTFEDIPTAIQAIPDESGKPSFSYGTISGLAPGSAISIHSIDGKTLRSLKADSHGHATIDLSQWGHGVFIVRTPNHSFKIKK